MECLENGGNGGNIGGRFGRDGMRFGINGKGMEWNKVHDTTREHELVKNKLMSFL